MSIVNFTILDLDFPAGMLIGVKVAKGEMKWGRPVPATGRTRAPPAAVLEPRTPGPPSDPPIRPMSQR